MKHKGRFAAWRRAIALPRPGRVGIQALRQPGLATADCERTPNSKLGERYGSLDGLDWPDSLGDRRWARSRTRDRVALCAAWGQRRSDRVSYIPRPRCPTRTESLRRCWEG